jgi:hypothetical protein
MKRLIPILFLLVSGVAHGEEPITGAFGMNRAGVKTARGGEWSAQTVKRLVKRLEALEAKDA